MSKLIIDLEKERDHLLGKMIGYKKYRIFDDIFANEIRELWEIIELKEIDESLIKEEKKIDARLVYKRALLYGYPKRNLCKQFKLEDKLQEISFNGLYNDQEYRWILHKDFDRTKLFLGSIKYRIKNISNVIIVISGDPNSGKSESSHTIAKFIQHQFEKIIKKKIEIKISFSDIEFYSTIKSTHFGDVNIRDETPRLTGKGSRLTDWHLRNILKIIRANQNSFLFVDPVELQPDITTFFLESAGKNKKDKITRYILYDKDHNVLGHIYIPLHNDEEFRKNYEDKKMENIKKVKKDRGKVSPEFEEERKQQTKIIKQTKNDYNEMERMFAGFNWNFDEKETIKKAVYKSNRRNKKRDTDIYIKNKIEERSQTDIGKDYGYSPQRINDIIKGVRSLVSDYKGEIFEVEYKKYLKSNFNSKNYHIEHKGGSGQPDITMEDLINNDLYTFSLKNLKIKANSHISKEKKHKPEYDFAIKSLKKFNNVFMYLILFNSSTNEIEVQILLKKYGDIKIQF